MKEKITLNLEYTQFLVVDALEDVKGQNILVFDTCEKSNIFDRVIIASGISNRQTKALAKSIVEKLKRTEGIHCRMEGEDNGEWVLVDCGDIVVNIMKKEQRDFYDLEGLWGEKTLLTQES